MSKETVPPTSSSAVPPAPVLTTKAKNVKTGSGTSSNASTNKKKGKGALLSQLLVACGKVSIEVSESMKQMKAVDRLYFKPSILDDYATATPMDKTYYEELLKLDMKKAAENYRTFTQDCHCMFSRILGQMSHDGTTTPAN